MEHVKKELSEALRNKDLTTKKTIHVFIYFCLLILIFIYFVSIYYLAHIIVLQ